MSKWRNTYRVHPIADAYPMMSDEELNDLASDIKTHGLRKRLIFLRDGAGLVLLDGRNRAEALERAGIEIDTAKHCQISEGMTDPIAYIASANIHRRHLSKEDRARMLVAAARHLANDGEVPSTPRHERGKSGSSPDPVKAAAIAAAGEYGISGRTIERALASSKDHPNHPTADRRAKASKKRHQKRETERERAIAAATPKTVDDARAIYLGLVKRLCTDLIAEHEIVWQAFQEMMREKDGVR